MSIDQDITNLPTPPSRSDSPSDFSDKADTFLGALPQLQTELNLYADEANTTQNEINTSETNAATSEQNAEDWAVDLTGLVLSTDYSSKAYAVSENLVPEGAAKEWSLKTDGTVDTTEYSAKAYALGGTGVTDVTGAAKEWATRTGSTVDGSDYSAKDYAVSLNTITEGSAKEWATTTDSTVDGHEYSSKDYASSESLISTGSSKDWASKLGSTVDGTDFSAKHYANNAEASASAAATSEDNSANSEAAAQQAATDAETALDSFTDQYLGPKSSEPTTDNDGDPLETGALYYNTTQGQLFIWNGSSWAPAAFDTNGALLAVNNLSDVDSASVSRTNLGLGAVATYENQDVRDLLSAGGDLSYDPATGGFSYTLTSSDVVNVLGYTPADEAVAISSGTGLTGGGNLSSNQTISADIATSAEAISATSDSVLMTPAKTLESINNNVSAGGELFSF